MRLVAPSRLAAASLALIGAAATLTAVTAGQAALVAPLADASVGVLLRLSGPLAYPAPPPVVEAAMPPVEAPSEELAAVATKGEARRGARPASSKPSAIFISAARVLDLAKGQARPNGQFVGAAPGRPRGLLLSGVGPLGIGLQDGDVLIEALGGTPTSPGQVIGAIIEARAQRVAYLSGTIWRRGQTFRITVEQPYLAAPASP
jgi:hypothetical protein